jgi:DNA-binding CsgD family transcriptional regulator
MLAEIDNPIVPYPASVIHAAETAQTDPQVLSELVARIYDAALDPSQCPDLLDSCRVFVGGMSAVVFAKDAAGLAGGVFYSDGRIEDHWAKLYFEKYARFDPATGGHLLTPLEKVVSTADLFADLDEFRESRFYREWSLPQGIIDFISAPIEKKGSWAAMFGVFRHERDGMADETAKERVRLLVPHIRRAVVIGKVIENGNFKAASLGDAVDGLAAGMFLVDARGRIMHSNAAGDALLGGGAITSLGGRVIADDYEANSMLAEVFAAAAEGGAMADPRGTAITLPGSDGENYVAHILPLTSGARRSTGTQYAAVAAMFVNRASLDMPSAPEVMARTFGLTLSELRVLNSIVLVGGVPETAEALGVAETTVKTHLHRVFAKTGTARQADLVRLVAGFASPLAQQSHMTSSDWRTRA